MAFDRYRFLGCSVRGMSSSIGWGAQASTFTVQLVEDPANGDVFAPPSVGTPVYFELAGFRFYGLFQKWEKKRDRDGNPIYEAVCTSPSEVLEGAQVILGAYNGSVETVYNLLNVYGFWENQAYGASQSSDAGMPWSRVRDGLLGLTNQPLQTVYGGPLVYRGVAYGLDLSELPEPPVGYRVGGSVSIGLLELINQICSDGGCDFYLYLDGLKIKVKTVSRRNAPPLGTVTAIAQSAETSGALVRSSVGLEARNELTSSFLVGGDITDLHITDSVTSFWGYDLVGNPTLGYRARHDFPDPDFRCTLAGGVSSSVTHFSLNNFVKPAGFSWPEMPFYLAVGSEIVRVTAYNAFVNNYTVERGQFETTATSHANASPCTLNYHSVLCDHMVLNSAQVAEIVGSVSYPTSEVELRLAKASYAAWAAYIVKFRPSIAQFVGMTSPVKKMGGLGALQRPALVNDDRDMARAMAAAAVNDDLHARELLLYDFIRGYADEYMGRKYAVSLPFVLSAVDAETLKVGFSYEVTEGGYLPEGATPLGLSELNADFFKTNDGRFRCFVSFSDLDDTDTSQVSPASIVIEEAQDTLYMEAVAEPGILFVPTPVCIVTLQGPLLERAVDGVGGLEIVAAVLQSSPAQAQPVLAKGQFGNIGVAVFPRARTPEAVAVPLKSNILTYGPWYAAGVPGKVRFEQDPSLVPWNYGGYTALNIAGFARVSEGVSSMQEAEAATVELAGAPTISLGDSLASGGPNLTNIQVSYGAQGVTTTYSFQTYTPRPYVFSKGANERLRRAGMTGVELRKSLRSSLRAGNLAGEAVGGAFRAAKAFFENAPDAVKRKTPHDVLLGYAERDYEPLEIAQPGVETPGQGLVTPGASMATAEEAVAFSQADDDATYQNTAAMSLTGLVRPFSTSPASGNLPHYQSPAEGFDVELSKDGLDPWGDDNDIDFFTWGNTYQGLHARRRGAELTNARAMCLRGPLVIAGWGYGTDGVPVPSEGDAFVANHLQRSDLWKTGPVDLLWDDDRAVWSCHDHLHGRTSTAVNDSTGTMTVYKGAVATAATKEVVSWGGATIPAGTDVHALFDPTDLKWYAFEPTVIPTGTAYTLFHRDGTNAKTWHGAPTISALTLGGTGPNAHGELAIKRSTGHGHTLKNSASLGASRIWLLPADAPAVGDVLSVQSAGSDTELEWLPATGLAGALPPYITPTFATPVAIGAANAPGSASTLVRSDHVHAHPTFVTGDLHPEYNLPAGTGYQVLWRSSSTAYNWEEEPTIHGLYLGGNGINNDVNGFVSLGHKNTTFRLHLESREQSSTQTIRLPNNTPSGSKVLTVLSYDAPNRIAETEWRSPLPDSEPNQVLWRGVAPDPFFTGLPVVKAIELGGSGISALDGYVGLGTPANDTYLYLSSSGTTQDTTWHLPGRLPPSGRPLGARFVDGSHVWLDWLGPVGASGGLTKNLTYVSDIVCTATGITLTRRTATFIDGLLINEY